MACFLYALNAPACCLPRSPTMQAVPPEWRVGNPFGPEANAARARGLIPLYRRIRRAAEWSAFAHATIQTGDILFRRGRSCNLAGNLTSRVLAGANGGRFSHDALANWEGDQLWIYDIESEGARKVPFELWMLDVAGNDFAIKRLRPEYRERIPQALAFCEDAYQRHVEFDFALSPTDERFYCSEMVEKAYRSAGLALSEPVPICQLEGYQRYKAVAFFVELCSDVRVSNPVFALGNEHYGTFGSPYLELVYDAANSPGPAGE